MKPAWTKVMAALTLHSLLSLNEPSSEPQFKRNVWISQAHFWNFSWFIIAYNYSFKLFQWPLVVVVWRVEVERPPGLVIKLFLHDCMFEVDNFTISIIHENEMSQFITFLFHIIDISNTEKYSVSYPISTYHL